jgi:hypothetical protein
MNNKFDELTKNLAQSVTRRAALKKFGVGLAGMALACFGLANKAEAAKANCLPTGTICALSDQSSKSIKYDCGKCCSHRYDCSGLYCICL